MPRSSLALRSTLLVQCRYSNLLLVDSSSTILLCARQVGAKLSSFRSLQDGGSYSLPPAQGGLNPEQLKSADEWTDVIKKTSDVMQKAKKIEGKGSISL